jgi:hypothetical protein
MPSVLLFAVGRSRGSKLSLDAPVYIIGGFPDIYTLAKFAGMVYTEREYKRRAQT